MKVSVTRIDLLLVENTRSITKIGNEGVPRIDLLLVENNHLMSILPLSWPCIFQNLNLLFITTELNYG